MKLKKKCEKIYSQAAYWLGIVIIGLAVGLSIQFVVAWVEPTAAPPNGNLEAPLNVSGIGQIKEGGLMLNTGGAATGLIVDKGNVKIGSGGAVGVPEKLEVYGNIKASGTVCGIDGCIGDKRVYYKEKLYPIPGNDQWNGGLGCNSGDVLLGCYIKHRDGGNNCREDNRLLGGSLHSDDGKYGAWLVLSENMSDHKCYLWRYLNFNCFTKNYRMVAKCLHL